MSESDRGTKAGIKWTLKEALLRKQEQRLVTDWWGPLPAGCLLQ